MPFRRIASALGKGAPAAAALTPEQAREALRVGWAVTAVSRTRIFHAVCLGQAIAAHSMLKRRGIPSTLHLGVAAPGTRSNGEPESWSAASRAHHSITPSLRSTPAPTSSQQGGSRGELIAHAWVTAGDLFVTGAAGHERFTEVSRIGSHAGDVLL